jgi:hypothetical protein
MRLAITGSAAGCAAPPSEGNSLVSELDSLVGRVVSSVGCGSAGGCFGAGVGGFVLVS